MEEIFLKEIVESSIREDLGPHDPLSLSLGEIEASAKIVAKEEMVYCGTALLQSVFDTIDPSIRVSVFEKDGNLLHRGDDIARLEGKGRSILSGERVALNFLQRLSGIATMTRKFVQQVSGTGAEICDTRKTTPNLRFLEKHAVRCGGGRNHRFSLSDGILIKDNSIKLFGTIAEAVSAVRNSAHHLLKIEVEVTNLDELDQAMACNVDAVLVDNFPVPMVREAVAIADGKVLLEASGNITLENVREYALTGVDILSSGMITHSAPAVDISLDVE